MLHLSFAIVLAACFIKAHMHLIDSRCYLAEGGSAENFLASENATVGSVLGTLSVNGDPAADITLSLREKDSPVTISNNSKNIILNQRLDKEGLEGPSSVYVNVICHRKNSNDPSFLIPVNIHVTDENDNSPKWIGAPYSINISETTAIGTRILQTIHAVDQDQPGPYSTIIYRVLPGPFSNFIAFASPFKGSLILKRELDYEMDKILSVQLRAQDQGIPPKSSDTTVTILVLDADDQNPQFSKDVYYGTIHSSVIGSTVLLHPESIKAVDKDYGINASLQFSLIPSLMSEYFIIDTKSGVLKIAKQLDRPISTKLVVKAAQLDNTERYALSTVIISQPTIENHLNNDVRLKPRYKIKIRENYNPGNTILNLSTNNTLHDLSYKILNASEFTYFSIDFNGNIYLKNRLDYETRPFHIFTVELNDGKNKQYTEVMVEVVDVNDWEPRFRRPQYTFKVSNSAKSFPLVIGRVEAADGDVNDKIAYFIRGENSRFFHIDSKGQIWQKENFTTGKVLHLQAVAIDSGIPPKETAIPLLIDYQRTEEKAIFWTPSIISGLVIICTLVILSVYTTCIYFKNLSFKTINNDQLTVDNRNNCANKKTLDITTSSRGSSSSISASASTILAGSLEREHELYAATIKNAVANSQHFNALQKSCSEIEKDLLINSEHTFQNSVENHSSMGNKSCSYWQQKRSIPNEKLLCTLENNSENNLTVYF
ncbi:protocadherin Fat 1 isoform X2 [Wyeomyia smithii]|uniref:protocadherin Fat 1 isoform X2 n=1 Tax=Wyeomyia smithii TaxID=174621 RepID=UPI002467B344|nr:protocadherin Fat 1 isoform X2 [Wyeomyia smithii]